MKHDDEHDDDLSPKNDLGNSSRLTFIYFHTFSPVLEIILKSAVRGWG